MIDQHTRIIATPDELRPTVADAYELAKLLLQDGRRVRITVREDDEPLTHRQRKFYHGVVLGQIAEQVRVGRRRYAMRAWKELYRDMFMFEQSTEDLGVKEYSDLIDCVIAHATTELGVVFHFDPREREAVRWKAPRRAPQRQPEEAVTY